MLSNTTERCTVTSRWPQSYNGGREAEIGTSGGRRFETARFWGRVWTLLPVNWKLLWKLWKTDPPAWIMAPTARLTRAARISLLSPSTSSSVSTFLSLFVCFPAKLILHKRSLWEYHCSHRTSDLMDLTVAPVQCHFRFKVTQVQQRRDQFKIPL